MRRMLVLILVLLLASPAAFAMRCGSRIVDTGAQDFQVRDRCGEPFWTDRYSNIEIVAAYGPVEQQRLVQFDVWYYNFGPDRFMRRVVLRDGILVHEDSLGYGVSQVGGDCNLNARLTGLTVGELYARCGEPVSRREQAGALVQRLAPGFQQWRDQRSEQWIYDDGEADFVRIVRIFDGRVGGVDRVRR